MLGEFLFGNIIGMSVALALIILLSFIAFAFRYKRQTVILTNSTTCETAEPQLLIAEIKSPAVQVQSQFFTLSRYDVFDHVAQMRTETEVFPIRPNILEKKIEKMPDILRCGERCFGLMFERNEIIFTFVLRMSEETAANCLKYHPLQPADLDFGKNWYSLTIDRTYLSKREVYQILDECYDYTFAEFYGGGECDIKAAREEITAIEKEFSNGGRQKIEQISVEAEKRFYAELKKIKDQYYSAFSITRREIADHMRETGNRDITVVERPKQPQLPMSLKHKDKTFAMLHGTDAGVIMIARLSDSYAEELSNTHPEICRAKFPRCANWYYIPVDGAFKDKEEVYRVLAAARMFVICHS